MNQTVAMIAARTFRGDSRVIRTGQRFDACEFRARDLERSGLARRAPPENRMQAPVDNKNVSVAEPRRRRRRRSPEVEDGRDGGIADGRESASAD